jgi:HK97 family phage major capsid protein
MDNIVEQIQTEFSKFKESNDARLREIEKFGAATQETAAAANRINETVTKLQERLDRELSDKGAQIADIEARLNRPATSIRTMDERTLRHYASWQATVQRKPLGDLSEVDLEFAANYTKAYRHFLATGDRRYFNEMSVGSDQNGGYWVDPVETGRIVEFFVESSPVRQFATIESISSGDRITGEFNLQRATGGWVGETQARPTTATPEIGEWEILLREQYANPRITQRLIDQANRDVGTWHTGKVRLEFALMEATAFVTGTDPKHPRGFLTYPAGTPAATSMAAYTVIKQVASGASAGLTADGLMNLAMSLKSMYRSNAIFGMTRATEAAVRLLKAGDGGYYFQQDPNGRFRPVLDGYPIVEFADMPAVGANLLPIFFGDLRQAYTIVDFPGIRVTRDDVTDKPYVHYYTTRYVGGDVVDFDAIALLKIAAS